MEVVLISNIISKGKYNLGLGKTGLNSEVVLILGGLNRDVLLYRHYRVKRQKSCKLRNMFF